MAGESPLRGYSQVHHKSHQPSKGQFLQAQRIKEAQLEGKITNNGLRGCDILLRLLLGLLQYILNTSVQA